MLALMGTLEVVVLGELNGNAGDLRDELLKGKSALLYGDRVLIKSHKVPFLLGLMAAKTRLFPQAAKEAGFDRETARQLAEELEAEGIRDDTPVKKLLLGLLRSDDPQPFLKFPEAVAQIVREQGGLDPKKYFRSTAPIAAKNFFRDQPFDEEDEALAAIDELVKLNHSGIVDVETADSQELVTSDLGNVRQAFEESLAKAIETFTFNPLEHPLLTSRTSLDISDLGHANAAPLAKANRAELAASMLADIPAFPTASVDEILDIRQRVSTQLGRFRAAVADLEEELNADIGEEDFVAEIEDLKLRRVAPELEELREGLRDEGLGQTASRSAPYLATGVLGLGASVAIGAPELASVVAVSAGATTAFAKEIVERAKLDRERKRHRLFLLFDIGQRLSRGGKG